MTPEERKRFARLNAAWLAGEKIDALAFHHNTLVTVTMPDGATKEGWIVGATANGPEPIYTVEMSDGTGDLECPAHSIHAN